VERILDGIGCVPRTLPTGLGPNESEKASAGANYVELAGRTARADAGTARGYSTLDFLLEARPQ